MALYIAIDEGYDPTKLSSQNEVVEFAEAFFTEDGNKTTKKDLAAKNLPLRLYEFSEEELNELKEGNSVRKEWRYIVHKL